MRRIHFTPPPLSPGGARVRVHAVVDRPDCQAQDAERDQDFGNIERVHIASSLFRIISSERMQWRRAPRPPSYQGVMREPGGEERDCETVAGSQQPRSPTALRARI